MTVLFMSLMTITNTSTVCNFIILFLCLLCKPLSLYKINKALHGARFPFHVSISYGNINTP